MNPPIGHVYGYTLEPVDDGTARDVVLRLVGHRPVVSATPTSSGHPEGALRATLGILNHTIRRGALER